MRAPAAALASQILIAAATTTGGLAAAKPEATLRANRTGVTLASTEVQARVKGSQATGLDKAEVGLDLDLLQARLFRNTVVAPDFTGSGLHYGRAVRSPYLLGLGVGDGFSTRLESGPYSLAVAALTGAAGDSLVAELAASELAAIDGALALQAGHRETGRETGSTSFAGAHVDFDMLNAEFSVRLHVGQEDVADGTRQTSAGAFALGLSSLLGEGDRLQAAVSRPVRPDFDVDAPDLQLFYRVPMPVGRLICTGGVETAERISKVRLSWGLRW